MSPSISLSAPLEQFSAGGLEHLTPASFEWLQWEMTPMPLCLQSSRRDSKPVHCTWSSKISPLVRLKEPRLVVTPPIGICKRSLILKRANIIFYLSNPTGYTPQQYPYSPNRHHTLSPICCCSTSPLVLHTYPHPLSNEGHHRYSSLPTSCSIGLQCHHSDHSEWECQYHCADSLADETPIQCTSTRRGKSVQYHGHSMPHSMLHHLVVCGIQGLCWWSFI